MGILKHLLFWPVSGPLYLTEFSLDKVQGVVRDRLTDDTPIKEQLLDLQLREELGEIDPESYAREEDRLMRRLREVRRWREEFGLATRGGVVQVGDDAQEAAGGGSQRPPSAPEGEDEAAAVPRGASLEVSVDWEEAEEDEDGAEEEVDDGAEDDDEEEWSRASRDDSGPASSSS